MGSFSLWHWVVVLLAVLITLGARRWIDTPRRRKGVRRHLVYSSVTTQGRESEHINDSLPKSPRRLALAILLLLLLLLAWALPASAKTCQLLDPRPWAAQIEDREMVFVARDLRTQRCWQTNQRAANQRHAPWSTFKLPHVLIALDTQAVSSADETMAWDPTRRPADAHWPDAWRQSQSLRTAFQRSSAWYFQDLVPAIGEANYRRWLRQFAYGNQTLRSGRDDFWLGGPLAISAHEQVAFLACVATTGCGASQHARRVLDDVAFVEARAGRRLYGKSGSGPVKPGDFNGPFEGWYVGYVRTESGVPLASFAVHVKAGSYAGLRTFRQAMAVQGLQRLGLWAP